MSELERAMKRFLRNFAVFGSALLIASALKILEVQLVPILGVAVTAALISAMSKLLRDKYGIHLPL